MTVDKIDVKGDSRVSHETADLNGRTYHYLLGVPKGEQKGTIFLVHGWPDCSMAWRYQMPMFLDMGLRVVAPDLMGFGRTDAPEDLEEYGFKRAAKDIQTLANKLGCKRIFLGGHDWGGAVVYRVCNHLPDFVTHLFVVCTPFIPPSNSPYVSLEERVATVLPNFGYQIQFANGVVEKRVKSREDMRQFFNGAFGGATPNKDDVYFDPTKGFNLDLLPQLGPSPLLSNEEIDYYTDEYMRHGLHSTFNWYRTGEVNHKGDQDCVKKTIDIPVLFVQALKDGALPPWMSAKMGDSIPNLTYREVDTGHWALWQNPEEINKMIRDWLEPFVSEEHAKSKI